MSNPIPDVKAVLSSNACEQSPVSLGTRGPKLAAVPRGHVARAIQAGKRPFLTCTVDASTFRAIDRYCIDAGVSRGVAVDRAISLLCASVEEKDNGL